MPDVPEKHIDDRARELAEGGSEGHEALEDDSDAAARAARVILEESEERTADPAARDPEDDSVVRRDSPETAASGDAPG
ncbi:MAG: hypothetical protein M3516_02860 [Actinomycetota bacterium]|nr:hypothetical protein [Actinomycetota bacterium]